MIRFVWEEWPTVVQWEYPTGVTAREVLDDLMQTEEAADA